MLSAADLLYVDIMLSAADLLYVDIILSAADLLVVHIMFTAANLLHVGKGLCWDKEQYSKLAACARALKIIILFVFVTYLTAYKLPRSFYKT